MKRTSYHTTLKELVFHGLLPEEYKNKIPKTNISRWKNDDPNRYKGSEINQLADKHSNAIILTINYYPKMFHAYAKLVETLLLIASKTDNFKSIIKENRVKIIDSVEKTKEIIPISKAVDIFSC